MGKEDEPCQNHRYNDPHYHQHSAFRAILVLVLSAPVSRISLRRIPARYRSGFLLLVLGSAFTWLTPAKMFPQEVEADDVLRVSTDLLLFPIRVRDKTGTSPTVEERDLVLEDKDRVTSGLYFARGADRVAFVFALDQSGSLRDIIGRQRDAALGLYTRFGEQSRIAVLRFAEQPEIAAPFGRNEADARNAFTFAAASNQHTAIFDAAIKAVEMFNSLLRVRSERRIVVLISDGLDNASRNKASAVIELARQNRVSFYVIHLPLFEPRNGRLAVRRTTSGFRELAEKTGGRYFTAATSALSANEEVDLSQIFLAIEEDLRSQYLLGFYLNDRANDGRRHTFMLSLPAGFKYQFGSADYSRQHKFFVERPRQVLQTPR